MFEDVQQSLLEGIDGEETARILFSGGEDSRAISGLVPKDFDCVPTTILDSRNLEYRLANKAAISQGKNLEWVQRPEGHYKQRIMDRIDLNGPGWNFLQTHIYGEVVEPFLNTGLIIGGYMADSLFKTDVLSNFKRNRAKKSSLLPPDPDKIRGFRTQRVKIAEEFFEDDLVAEVQKKKVKTSSKD